MAELKQTRPFFLNLLRIRFPVGAIASIGHRVSGVVLVFSTPILVYLFDASLGSAQEFERICALLDSVPVKVLVLLVSWAFTHHFLAGIRHLLMDIDVGSALPAARFSAWLVNAASAGIALLIAGILL